MAPQLLSLRKYTSKSEIWSLGIMFYQLLFTNTPWYPISCVQEIIKKIYTDCINKIIIFFINIVNLHLIFLKLPFFYKF
jgi:serine/threonine protein kinase